MNTTNGTDWDKCGNAIIIYHQQEDIREMLKELEGEG